MDDRFKFFDELKHFGVPGMKWGVRNDPERNGHRKKRSHILPLSDDEKEVSEYLKKSTSSLSNKELLAIVNRMNLKSQVQRFKDSSVETKKVDSMLGRIGNSPVLSKVGSRAMAGLLAGVGMVGVSALAKKYGRDGAIPIFVNALLQRIIK